MENRRERMNLSGIIHCQILEGKYPEAKQQIEFQNEVQTANSAELAHLKALLAKHENAVPPDQIVQLFDVAAEQHFKNLRVCSDISSPKHQSALSS